MKENHIVTDTNVPAWESFREYSTEDAIMDVPSISVSFFCPSHVPVHLFVRVYQFICPSQSKAGSANFRIVMHFMFSRQLL